MDYLPEVIRQWKIGWLYEAPGPGSLPWISPSAVFPDGNRGVMGVTAQGEKAGANTVST